MSAPQQPDRCTLTAAFSAIQEYEAFESRLAKDLELEPSAEMKALVEDIRAAAAEGASPPRSAGPLVEEAGAGEREVPASAPAAAAQPERRRHTSAVRPSSSVSTS